VGVGVLVACLLAVTGWLAWTGLRARDALTEASGLLSEARQRIVAGDLAPARALVARAGRATGTARAETSDPVWRLVAALPGVGDTPRAVQVTAAQADLLARDVIPAALHLAGQLDPSRVRPEGDRIDVGALTAAQEPIRGVQEDLRGVRAALGASTDGWVPGVVAGPIERFRGTVDQLAGAVDGLARVVRLAPAMLGAEGPRRYFLGFQNPAEARGTGGLVGAYGILSADGGRLRFTELGTDSRLRNLNRMPVNLGEDFHALYGEDPAWWVNSNMSPHFPYAGRIWTAAWERTRGERLDGVLAVDPVALSYLLGVTGPVSLPDGERISAGNVVQRTLVDAYVRFDTDNTARKRYLMDVSAAAVDALLSGAGDPRELVKALARAVDERRLLLWSAHPAEERELATTGVGGALPHRPGPYLMVAVNNAAGSKLDYYLDRQVSYTGSTCRVADRLRETAVRVRLTNEVAPGAGLPDYVAGRLAAPQRLPVRNANVELVGVYAGLEAQVVDVRLDGKRVGFRLGQEQGHLAVIVPVTLPPRSPRTVEVTLSEPASTRAPTLAVQPLVRPQQTVVHVPACGT
jgi:hypothetical protein